MSAIRSFLYMTPCIVMMLTGASVFSDDTFYVFAPDQKNQQMLSLSVQTGPTGVSISKGKPLRLPFGPSSVATHPNGKHLIVNSPAKNCTSQDSSRSIVPRSFSDASSATARRLE